MKTLVARSTRMQGRHIGRLSDFTMKWFTDLYGDEWSDWTRLAIEYLAHLNEGVPLDNRKTLGNVRNDISWFLEHYLWREGFPSKTTEFFAMINSANNMTRCLGSNSSLTTREAKQRRLREIKTFVQWLMDNKENHFSNIPKSNPFVNKNSVRDGRSSDINFTWLCDKHGPNWGSWRSYATAWVSTKEGTITHFLGSLSWFFEKFLINHGYGANPIEFFQPSQTRVDINLSINSLSISNLEKARRSRQIHDFVDWVIKKDFREHDDRGKLIPMFKNPVIPMKSGYPNRNETVYNPIPYGYIKQLRAIICPAGSRSFNDWSWAHSAWRSDWIEIEDEQANKTDPNCVLKTVSDGERTKTFIWNPVRSVALLIKLHLPLRSYQVRVLDSGEADTWRYESGLWVNNNHYSFAKGTISAPWQKGVFRRRAESKGTNTKKPSISKSRLPNKAEDLLRRIEDPALRAIVGTIIAERNRFMAENRLLKAQSSITIDCRSEEISTVSDKARNPLESLLSVTEIEALRYASSPKLLEDNGWTTSKTGRLKDGNGKTIMKVGFTSAIAKLVDKIDSADAILQG